MDLDMGFPPKSLLPHSKVPPVHLFKDETIQTCKRERDARLCNTGSLIPTALWCSFPDVRHQVRLLRRRCNFQRTLSWVMWSRHRPLLLIAQQAQGVGVFRSGSKE